MNINCGHCKGRHASVEMVRTCAFSSQADSKTFIPTPPALASFIAEAAAQLASQPQPVTEPGMYQKPNGIVYRVKRNKAGTFLYAEKATPIKKNGASVVKFEYISGAMKELTADMRMTLESAARFGLAVGACCICGRTLTAKHSVEAGIGPICAGKI